MKGLIQIYCGEGKGKTTAAIGQAVRSAGCGLSVVFVRFLKTDCSGELTSLERIPGIRLIPCERNFGFFWNMTEEEKKEAASVYQAMLEQAERAAVRSAETKDTVLVMDEIIATYGHGLVDREKFLEFLKNRPENLEVVMTGRDPAPELTELADYVSEIRKVKHPFDRGIHARKGIEF
ncbi:MULTISPECIES: cob(I)yrinic acid a,c-diamide adenosyltransferase [unclassified Candidatus Paralachnospira]|uniref:cob(I)yrinic acid a,c-diamide adenosyltransferase n=1 Tax=unclassified Candidatus Paralachnospira TaxID=3099471 RepID=UPI00305F1E2C